MKFARKLVTLAIVLAMVMAFMIPTGMAATIKVQDVLDGETYTAYKILNYTNSGDAYSYYLSATEYDTIGAVLEAAGFKFTASADGTQHFVNNTVAAEGVTVVDVAAAAAYLAEHAADLGEALGKATATGANGEASFTNLATGYYFVTSTTGSLCALHSETDIATAVEKNTVPSVEKTQSATNGDYAETTLHLNMGDTVYYQITVTDGKGTDNDIVLEDVLSAGLTLQNDITVTDKNGKSVGAGNYTIDVDGNEFTLTLSKDYVATLDKDDTVIIQYSAKVNANAIVDDADDNKNTVTMTYSQQSSTDTVYVATYDFQVMKTDGTNFLDGAEFKLYTEATGGTQIMLNTDTTGYYVDVNGSAETTIDINSATGVNVRGLKPGTYYLEEVVVPGGYNKLPARTAVTITSGATAAVQITVINEAGAVLPSTGGMGTTIFYVLGGVLFLGALVILFTNKRMRQN